jgi:hypothetical protein
MAASSLTAPQSTGIHAKLMLVVRADAALTGPVSQAGCSRTFAAVTGLKTLYFYLNIHACRKVQAHQHVNSLGIRVQDIDQAVMSANLKVLVRIFIDKG